MPWKCSLCEDSDEFRSKDTAKDHVEDNHIKTLLEASIHLEEEKGKFGFEPIYDE